MNQSPANSIDFQVNTHTHTQPGFLPHSQLLMGCSSAPFNHEQSQWSNGSQSSLVTCLFCVVWVCLCVYKRKQHTDRQDSLGSYSVKSSWGREIQYRERDHPEQQQQEIMRLLCDYKAKMCWFHIFNCGMRCELFSTRSLGSVNKNLQC